MGMSAHQSARAKSVDWLTPPVWIAKLGPFDLDPACPVDMPWRTAETMYTPLTDGLAMQWKGRVWLNPPFGTDAAKWMKRIAEHGDGIALIPARTETAMFYESVWGKADAVCFVRGRPHFHRIDGMPASFNSGAPIALIAYGAANVAKLRNANLGITLMLTAPLTPDTREG